MFLILLYHSKMAALRTLKAEDKLHNRPIIRYNKIIDQRDVKVAHLAKD